MGQPDDDRDLKPGVDKPTRWQYVAGTLFILLLALLAYWRMG
jgi:hypothetical protein